MASQRRIRELRGFALGVLFVCLLDFLRTRDAVRDFHARVIPPLLTGSPQGQAATLTPTPTPTTSSASPPSSSSSSSLNYALPSVCGVGRGHDGAAPQRNAYLLALSGDSSTSFKNLDLLRAGAEAVCSLKKHVAALRDVPVVVLLAHTPSTWGPALLDAGADRVVDLTGVWDPREDGSFQPVYGCEAFQQRSDGWATYTKLAAFNLTEDYDRIMVFDADVVWTGDPFPLFAAYRDALFVGFREYPIPPGGPGSRIHVGLNSHVHLLRPDKGMFRKLLRRAAGGFYRVLTNTEQDVLESEFAVDALYWGEEGRPPVPHLHDEGFPNPLCYQKRLPGEG